MARRRALCLIVIAVLLLLTACSSRMKTASSRSVNAGNVPSAGAAADTQPKLQQNVDLTAEAASLKETPGRVALSMIICKMDNSRVLDDLVQKDSQDLFEILCEIAQQKSRTLESLNEQYGLVDILASENIFITIKSNTVTPAPSQGSSGSGWIAKFQDAINKG